MHVRDEKILQVQAKGLVSKLVPILETFVNENKILTELESYEVASSAMLAVYTDLISHIYLSYISPDNKEACIHDLLTYYYELLHIAFGENEVSNVIPFKKI